MRYLIAGLSKLMKIFWVLLEGPSSFCSFSDERRRASHKRSSAAPAGVAIKDTQLALTSFHLLLRMRIAFFFPFLFADFYSLCCHNFNFIIWPPYPTPKRLIFPSFRRLKNAKKLLLLLLPFRLGKFFHSLRARKKTWRWSDIGRATNFNFLSSGVTSKVSTWI